jgi:hypothetical protein
MKKYLNTWVGLAAGLALFGIVLAAAGCGGGASSGDYSLVTTAFSGANITFEYPNAYQMPPGGNGDTSITYLHYLGQVETYNADAMFFIETDNVTAGQSAASMMDQSVTAIMKSSMGFQLIKRTTAKVAGYKAEMLAFTATFADTPLSSTTTTTWVAYFVRGDRVWEMGVMANSDLADTARSEYQHLVDTFSFK